MEFSIILLFVCFLVLLAALPEDVFTGHSDFVYESGLKITGDFITVKDKVFVDIPIGVVVWGSNNLIVNCTFINNSDEGVLLLGDSNIIQGCCFYGCNDGIELQDSCSNIIVDSKFFNSIHMGIDGIGGKNFNNVIKNCIFYDSVTWFRSVNDNVFIDCKYFKKGA